MFVHIFTYFSKCMLLGSIYVSIRRNRLCKDDSYIEIDNKKDCKRAAEKIGVPFGSTETKKGYPKGCYVNGAVFFNTHSVGSKQKQSTPLCIAHGQSNYLKFRFKDRIRFKLYFNILVLHY